VQLESSATYFFPAHSIVIPWTAKRVTETTQNVNMDLKDMVVNHRNSNTVVHTKKTGEKEKKQ
jgi:hypothetical protein